MKIILVHGAFADASSWSPVIELLQSQGHDVVAPANPLRGIKHDAAYLSNFISQIDESVLLVGHSYGGAVMTNAATSHANVIGLVYVSAFAPDEGEVLIEIENGSKDSVLNEALVELHYPDFTGSGSETAVEYAINAEKFHEAFAADLTKTQSALMAATQRPVASAAFTETNGIPAWKTIPSWAIVSTEDKAAGSDVTRSMAERAKAKITEIEGSHVVLLSKPQEVADVIINAVESAGTPES